jgi:hypothetical protein
MTPQRKPKRMFRMRLRLPVVIAIFLAAAPIWAHHIVIHLDVADTDGKVATWLVNTLPPSTALRRGFSKNSFAVGTEISVEGFQALDGSNHLNGRNIELQDGQKIATPDCFDNGLDCFEPVDGKSNRIQ